MHEIYYKEIKTIITSGPAKNSIINMKVEGKEGGTYVTTEDDESKMVFEAYNLDNSTMIFHDGPFAAHE
jgi:hypothetical protein